MGCCVDRPCFSALGRSLLYCQRHVGRQMRCFPQVLFFRALRREATDFFLSSPVARWVLGYGRTIDAYQSRSECSPKWPRSPTPPLWLDYVLHIFESCRLPLIPLNAVCGREKNPLRTGLSNNENINSIVLLDGCSSSSDMDSFILNNWLGHNNSNLPVLGGLRKKLYFLKS